MVFPSGFPTKTLYIPLSSRIRATFPARLIILHFFTLKIAGEKYKSFSSSLCNLKHFPVSSTLLGPNILSTPCSHITTASFPPAMWTTEFHTHTKQMAKLKFCGSWNLNFYIASSKTKHSVPNDNKHFLTSICSFFLLHTVNAFIYEPTDATVSCLNQLY